MIKISPSILACDFARMGEEIARVDKFSDYLHVDVMDGIFVPNISFGMPVIKSIRKVTDIIFDVHLMIERPERYIDPPSSEVEIWEFEGFSVVHATIPVRLVKSNKHSKKVIIFLIMRTSKKKCVYRSNRTKTQTPVVAKPISM